MKKTIIFYYHNFGGLGHGNRISLIIQNIINDFGSEYKVIVLNSGEKQDFLFKENKNLKIINLPNYKIDNYEIIYDDYSKKIETYRKTLFQKLLTLTKIETLVIEHYPFGRNFLDKELKFLIYEYRKNNNKGKVFSSVRDIFDLNSIQNENLKLFDRFLIHSDKKIINYDKYFDKEISKKIIYTGFIVNEVEKEDIIEKNHIMISIGGGQDGLEYIINFLEKLNHTNFSGPIYINLGKNYSEENISKIKNSSKYKLEIKPYFDNFLELKLQAKLIVTMGGYNNFMENIFYNKKSIIFPRKSDKEQQTRLEIFAKKFDYILDGNKLNSDTLNLILSNSINSPALLRRKMPERHRGGDDGLNFSGAYFSASFITNYKKYKYIKIRLTNACNATCDMCGVIKRKREYNDLLNIKKSILDFYKLGGEVVNFTGGEPTIYKGFFELLDFSKSLGLITSVSTNGSLLGEKFYEKIINKNSKICSSSLLIRGELRGGVIDYIDISIDGLYELHDKIRGINGLFSIIDKNIENLKNLGIIIHINFTIRKDNIETIKEFFYFFKNKNIDSISFSMISTSPINDTMKLFPTREQLNKFYNIDKKYIIDNSGETKVIFSPDYIGGDLNKFVDFIINNNNFEKKHGEKCNFISSKKEIRINENGGVSPCCILDDYELDIGNIKQNNLLNIICSKKYESFINKRFPNISEACLNCKIET